MSVAAPRKSTTRRTLLIAALGVLALDAFAIATFGNVGLKGFPGDVIKRALEPIVPHTVIDLGGDPTHGMLGNFYLSSGTLAFGFALAIVVGLAAGLPPALSAMRLNIVEALRRV